MLNELLIKLVLCAIAGVRILGYMFLMIAILLLIQFIFYRFLHINLYKNIIKLLHKLELRLTKILYN